MTPDGAASSLPGAPDDLRLYWHPFSLFPRRVRIALREKGLNCEEVVVDLPGGATRRPAFRGLNPFGHVPVLEHGELILFESLAILEYLEEIRPDPPLLPSDPAGRARARQFMLASGHEFVPPFKRWLTRLFTPESEWDHGDQERASTELATHLDVLESRLPVGGHLVGEFSLADVAFAPVVCELASSGLGHLLEEREAVRDWVERLRSRPSICATSPLPG